MIVLNFVDELHQGLIQLLERIYLSNYIENLQLNLPVKKGLIIFRDESKMLDVLEFLQEEFQEFDDNETCPFVMNHGGLGPVTTKNIISRKNEISLYLSTSKMLMGIDLEQISVVIFVRPLNMMLYVLYKEIILPFLIKSYFIQVTSFSPIA